MSDIILGGDFTVYYEAENRQKRIDWTGSATGTRTINELYSALQDLFDELNQMDDGTPMSPQTPTEYTIGIIDAGDDDPWFIDRETVEHLTGGALKTASWLRIQDSNTGIVRVSVSGNNITSSEIGLDISHADGDAGTLLDVISDTLWIRPDSDAVGNNWDSISGTITCNALTASQTAAADTGESLWAGVYSIGTIEDKTHLYVYQNSSNLTGYKSTTDWWVDGHIDILVNVKEVDVENDSGYITVLARQFSKTCAYYIVGLSSGGRNPIPLSTGDDLDNETGYREFTGSSGTGTFQVGEEINKSGTDKRAIITAVGGTTSAPILTYYLIGDPLTDFQNGDTDVTGDTSGATCTAGTPSNVGSAALVGVSITHGVNETFDIDEDGMTENYSIVIDCSDETLADVYEWCKYITRRGDINIGNTDDIEGEQYLGNDYRIEYTSITGAIAEGDIVSQDNTSASGTVVAHNLTDDILILRNSRGTFNNTDTIRKDGSNYVTGVTCTAVTPIATAPYGTFAGGKFFCAPGVVLDNVPSADANNFQLTDDEGNVVTAPNKVTVQVGNSRQADRIAVFRLTVAGGGIKKDEYSGTVQSIGAVTLVVGEAITADTVGKTAGGIIRLIDYDADEEYRMRFSSWTGSTFTLASSSGLVADAGTDEDTIIDSGEFASAKVGDIIRNTTRNAITYVTEVTDNDEVQVSPSVSGQTTSDTFEINCLPVATATEDDVYVPFLDVYETVGDDVTPGDESVSVTYSSDIPVRVRARQAGDILPYEVDSTITSTGMSNNIIRTSDAIYT